ncbi:MAG TPA: isocitrate lyase/phosphoenolpyruvate mutase family protein [Terriglobales bacterium]|jgi:2-methylisocitrate lyase-like PEP mutase family enzyme|nr:isocitrate lyase/phosphoenolpyruvate mutase family protein [Terriglobales bacterium]
MESQTNQAIQFRQLHRGPGVLILPNAWDVASARIFEEAGFPAIATTSAGIAFSLGYPDGQRIPREEMMARIARIARAVHVPVTADVESGYGSTPEDAARTTRELIQAGVVGMNLEDASGRQDQPLSSLQLAVEKIQAAREAAVQLREQIVINARTEIYLLAGGNPDADYSEALRRLVAFRDAGADCVFAPGLKDAETIERLAKAVECPLNILAGVGTPSIPELAKLGVARVSVGSGPIRATLGLLRRIAEEIKTSGTYNAMEGAIHYAEVNKLLGG